MVQHTLTIYAFTILKKLKYLKKKGRFMEIGKRNVYTKEQMTKERPDVYYELLALDYYMAYDQPKFNELLTRLTPEVAKGWWAGPFRFVPVSLKHLLKVAVDVVDVRLLRR